MKILRLKKKKLGDNYDLIEVTYKTLFGKKKRDAVRVFSGYQWADTGTFIPAYKSNIIGKFHDSSEFVYTPNN